MVRKYLRTKRVPKTKRVSKAMGKDYALSFTFRGRRYYYYRDAYARSRDLKNLVARLHKEGYKTRLVGRGRWSPVVDVYTNPEIVNVPYSKILRFG